MEGWRFEIFAHIASHVNENKQKKLIKNGNMHFFLQKFKKVWMYSRGKATAEI